MELTNVFVCQEYGRLPAMSPTDAFCKSEVQLCLVLHLVLQLIVQVDIPKMEINSASFSHP